MAYVHSWEKCQILVKSKGKLGYKYFKSQFMDSLYILHGSQVENPDLEAERYRSLLCCYLFLPFTRLALNLLFPFPVVLPCSFSPVLFSICIFCIFPSSSLHSYLTSSSHSLPSLHCLFLLSVTHFSRHSALEQAHQDRLPIGLCTANSRGLGKEANASWNAAKV